MLETLERVIHNVMVEIRLLSFMKFINIFSYRMNTVAILHIKLLHGGAVFNTVTSQQERSGFEPAG